VAFHLDVGTHAPQKGQLQGADLQQGFELLCLTICIAHPILWIFTYQTMAMFSFFLQTIT